jgi:hypothetical protein
MLFEDMIEPVSFEVHILWEQQPNFANPFISLKIINLDYIHELKCSVPTCRALILALDRKFCTVAVALAVVGVYIWGHNYFRFA